MMRPSWLEFPEDEYGIDEDRQFFLGSGLLVRPVMESGAQSVSAYLPGEEVNGGSTLCKPRSAGLILLQVYFDFDDYSKKTGPGAVYIQTDMDKVCNTL